MSRITLHNLSRVFRGGVRAIDGLSLEVRDGERMVIMGQSGCGKTTTLRLIAGLEKPDSGTIRFDEVDVTRLGSRRRGVAMVFQDAALYPHMTVQQNLRFRGRRGGADAEPDHRQVGERLGIGNLLDRRPHELSGGQRQRVALARAVSASARCILLDEPLNSLEAAARAELQQALLELHRAQPFTMIYVTHDQREAMILADRIAVMCDGQVVQVAAPHEIYDKPMDVFVAQQFGQPPMQLLRGRIVQREGNLIFESGGVGLSLPHRLSIPPDRERELLLGIRPESACIMQGDSAGAAAILQMNVTAVQWLGDRTLVQGSVLNGQALICEVARGSEAPQCGDVVSVALDTQGIHWFEASTGQRLRCDGADI